MRKKDVITLLAFTLAGTLLAIVYRHFAGWNSDDLAPVFCRSFTLLVGGDPYGPDCVILDPRGLPYASYPLPALLLAMPFALFGQAGEMLAWGLMSGVMAWALVRDGKYWRLLAFLSPAYVQALFVFQLSPLLLAAYCLPGLLPLVLVKPHTGLSVFLAHITKRRVLIVGVAGLLTLVIDPSWPLRWLAQSRGFQSWIPALSLPVGPLLFLAFAHWKDPRARFLGLMALTPQRAFYDLLPLWALPNTARQSIALSAVAWVGFFLNQWISERIYTAPLMSTLFAYTPLLVIVFAPDIVRLLAKPYHQVADVNQ